MSVGCTVHQLQSFRHPQIFQIDYQFCTVGFFTRYITVRGRQSPEKLLELFSIRRNYGCVGGVCAFRASALRHDVTSRGREIRWSILQGHGGVFF